jgi:hypothetical protein
MSQRIEIPMFPLALLPLPGELVPLHIFEPRYRQLLQDAEADDINFGIYFNQDINKEQIGSCVKLESILKRYPDGETDIIVKCNDIFTMQGMQPHYKNKMYQGGSVLLWSNDDQIVPSQQLFDLFAEYMIQRNIKSHFTIFNYFEMAIALNLDTADRYKFLTASSLRKESFLISHIKYQHHIYKQEQSRKDVFHLN